MKINILFVASHDKVGFVWLIERKILPFAHYFSSQAHNVFQKFKKVVFLIFFPYHLIYMKLT